MCQMYLLAGRVWHEEIPWEFFPHYWPFVRGIHQKSALVYKGLTPERRQAIFKDHFDCVCPQPMLLHATSSFVHHFVANDKFKLELQSWNAQFGSKSKIFLSRVTLKFDRWPSKTIGYLSYATSSFVHHFVAIGEFKLELQSRNAQFGSKSMIFSACDLEIWQMTCKNNRAPLLSNIKLCASFCSHWWIQTGVTVPKCPIWVKIDDFFSRVTLNFDRWPAKTIGNLF